MGRKGRGARQRKAEGQERRAESRSPDLALRSQPSALRSLPARPSPLAPRPFRRGFILPTVLVVIVLVSLGAYAFTEQMLAEKQAAAAAAREAQARAFAYSGVEYATNLLTYRLAIGEENLYHDPLAFQQVLLPSAVPRGQGRFSIVAPMSTPGDAGQSPLIRYGLKNESGKLNLNAVVDMTFEDEEQALQVIDMLTGGPTEPIMMAPEAAVILDYIDGDQEPREFGREDEFCLDRPLVSLDELLALPEVTRDRLYGEDVNRNGRLDPGEDGDGDGLLLPGWDAFFTVDSLESNLRSDGTPKININQSLPSELYDELFLEFSEDEARFITALRAFGPVEDEEEDDSDDDSEDEDSDDEDSEDDDDDEESSGGRRGMEGLAQSLARGLTGGGNEGETVTRGGLDLSKSAAYEITSIYDLVDAQVEIETEVGMELLESPWRSDNAALLQELPILLDALTLSDGETIPGRVNINEARREVLLGLPGIDESLAERIINSRPIDSSGQPRPELIARQATTGWLLVDRLVTIDEMRELDKYVTARGDVFRAQVIGHFDEGGPIARVEAVIDATVQPARIKRIEDLTDLGRGFTPTQLLLGVTP